MFKLDGIEDSKNVTVVSLDTVFEANDSDILVLVSVFKVIYSRDDSVVAMRDDLHTHTHKHCIMSK